MTYYAKLTSGMIGAWFVLSLAASSAHLFETAPNQPPLAFGLAVAIPMLGFAAWFAVSPSFRAFLYSLDPRTLTLVQSWRVAGYVFLVLATFGILPKPFALSAGWGDLFIGITAPLVAFTLARPNRRGSFLLWQLLGVADLVNAVAQGMLAGVIEPHGISTQAMMVLPMSMIPTFAVPLMLLLHLLCIAQALPWPAESKQQRVQSATIGTV